jgi:signal transduction histidine kinase
VLLEEVDRMQRLVDDLLLLANAGHPDFIRKEPIQIAEFIHQVMEKIRVLGDRRWQIDETADYLMEADPQRLTQALVQLAANAVKYTGISSTIALGSRIEGPTAPDGSPLPEADTLLLWVRDTGTGIAAEGPAQASVWRSSLPSLKRTAGWPPSNLNTAKAPPS